MQLYCEIDLHSNNNLISLIDDNDRLIREKHLDNDLDAIQLHLMPFRDDISGNVVEFTYNLMGSGLTFHIFNALIIQSL